ncbi:YhcN/YlaJ family sporulation lipoprotein [Bacillus sp. FSL K6-3431]|uniref:YhcN/YlaJ family sporulation lipoprotein n=1 Tax=Bacillus sp. FSL K6-3431 TaxID=2921500 RepID=UPI0030F59399
MNVVKPVLCIGLISVMLMGCGATKNNDNITNNNEPLGVRYTPNTNNTTSDLVNDNRNVTDNRNGVGMTNNTNQDDDRKIDIAEDVADRVTEIKEVDSAHVLVTDNNAYVAVRLNGNANNELTNNVEKKIEHKVKEVDKNVNNVYISENPDFYTRMESYRDDIRAGHPVSGFFEEFTRTVKDIFPNQSR